MAIDVVTLALSKKYTKETVEGAGAVAGKPCQIQSIAEITGGHRVTFLWVDNSSVSHTSTMDVMDGVDGQDGSKGDTGLGIKAVAVSASNHLVVTYDDDTTEDAGEIEDVSTSFDKITDVDLSNLTDGQILKYNATTGKWENASAGSVDTNLVDLNDVDVESLTDGQIIVWDATSGRWVNADNEGGASALSDLTDTTITTPSDGEVLVYDGTAGKWVNDEIETVTSLSELTDTTISSPSDGQVLAYDSTSGKWENTTQSAGSLAGLSDTTITSPTAEQPLTYDATNSKWINGGIIPIANGGTGNNTGYVQAGRKANTTIGANATAEGQSTTASGARAHAEGYDTKATSNSAHAEGSGTTASNGASHAEGSLTTASGNYSHAQNRNTVASADASSAAGIYTTAGYANQFVVGQYNNNKNTNIFEVGIGTGTGARANGLELDTSGNLKTAGTITDGDGNSLSSIAAQLGYLEQTVTLSTSASTTVTFTDAKITANSFIEYACSQWDLVPESITAAAGSCTIVLPKVDSAQSVTVRIYVR